MNYTNGAVVNSILINYTEIAPNFSGTQVISLIRKGEKPAKSNKTIKKKAHLSAGCLKEK
ncbi:hypothetical protein E2C01_078951 [Portunus trituberculatus]|uniref:Uncharacterized protein n=1 Tax=Portunus trituberculatus TaxID=210409 RepID=A0A5B7IK72_PORTR|nr:hypothetical protein [Portunus trituberculatus]